MTGFDRDRRFALLGLMDMYNSQGAIESMKGSGNTSGVSVDLSVRGCGWFGACLNVEPMSSSVDGGMLTLTTISRMEC